jgi:hypothetical protein
MILLANPCRSDHLVLLLAAAILRRRTHNGMHPSSKKKIEKTGINGC